MNWFDAALLSSALRLSTPLTLAAIGGLYSERSGVVNIALEGCMLFGAFSAGLAAYYSGNPWIGFLSGMIIGGVAASLHAVVTVSFKGDQIVSGMAINILAMGLPAVFCAALFETPSSTPPISKSLPIFAIPLLHKIPVIGEIFFHHTIPVFLSIFVVWLTGWIIWKTVFGLRLRAAGENPAAAESLGVRIRMYRYYGVIISGMLAGMAGAYLSIGHGSQFIKNMTAGRGYIALAALIFGKWKPWQTFGACLLFGTADALQIRLQGISIIPLQFIQIIPYIITIFILVGVIGRSKPPAAAGKPY